MLTIEHLPLAANIADLIEPAIVILLFIIGGVSKMMTAKPKAKPAPRPRLAPPPNPGAAGGQGGQPMTLEESLRREVEEFMRRAKGGEPTAPPKQPPQRAPAPRPPAQRPAPQRPPLRTSIPAAPPREQPPRRLAEMPSATPAPSAPLGSGVGQHVAQHLGGTQALAAHAQSLGTSVAAADARMEAHVQQKFTHQLGALQHQTTTTESRSSRPPAAQALVDLLRQPGGMRHVVLASEVLRRPEERWNREGT
jgi:hypothetical protein